MTVYLNVIAIIIVLKSYHKCIAITFRCHIIKGGCKLVNVAQVMIILSIVVRSVSWGLLRRLMGKVVYNSL